MQQIVTMQPAIRMRSKPMIIPTNAPTMCAGKEGGVWFGPVEPAFVVVSVCIAAMVGSPVDADFETCIMCSIDCDDIKVFIEEVISGLTNMAVVGVSMKSVVICSCIVLCSFNTVALGVALICGITVTSCIWNVLSMVAVGEGVVS